MAIEKLTNTTFNRGVAENFRNRVKESGYVKDSTSAKPMLEPPKEGVLSKGFKIDTKA